MIKTKSTISLLLTITLALAACLKGKQDSPPDLSNYDPGLKITHNIAALKRLNGRYDASLGGDTSMITEEVIIGGIVTANDRSGNFYKQLVIQDDSAAIMLLLDANNIYTDYPIGRKIYVKCKDLWLGYDGGLPVLGGKPNEQLGLNAISKNQITKHLLKANINNVIKLDTIDIAQAQLAPEKYYNRLIYIENAQFKDTTQTYAQPNATTNRDIEDCNGKTLVVRNSNYSNFATIILPKGKGSVSGIYTVYISSTSFKKTPQLLIRDTNDVQMTETRCNGTSSGPQFILNEEFNNLNNWIVQNVKGDQVWNIETQFGKPKPCAMMNGYAGGAKENEDWLISKQIDLMGYSKISLSFDNAGNFSGNDLECYISVNYSGTGSPYNADWVSLPAKYDKETGFKWTASGKIDLSDYKDQKIRLAFKYTSTNNAAASWEIDNVKISVE